MEAELQFVEIEARALDDDDFAVEHAASGESGAEWIEQLGEVAIEGLFVAALQEDFVSVAEDKCAEAVPFGFEKPILAGGEFVDSFGEHGEKRRIDGELHEGMLAGRRSQEWRSQKGE